MVIYYLLTLIFTWGLIFIPIKVAKSWLEYESTPTTLTYSRTAALSNFIMYMTFLVILAMLDLFLVVNLLKDVLN